jgi:hypothetical protein
MRDEATASSTTPEADNAARPLGDCLISQRDLAKRWGVHVRSLQRWERDPRKGLPPTVRIGERGSFRWFSAILEYERNLPRRAIASDLAQTQAIEAPPARLALPAK